MSRADLESELKENVEQLRMMTRQSQKPLKIIEEETKHNLTKAEQLKKLFIERQAKHDIFEEKFKFYQTVNENCKKRKRPKSISFVHSSRTRNELLETFIELGQHKKDKRIALVIQILQNDHIKDTEKFKKLVSDAQANPCIIKSIEKRKLIHENYEQIYQLYEALFNVALPDSDDDKEHNEIVQKLTRKLDKIRNEYMKQLNDRAVMKEVNEKISVLDEELNNLKSKKKEIEEDIEQQKKDDIEYENRMFELQMSMKEQKKLAQLENNEELKRKIDQLKQLTIDIQSQNKDSEDQLIHLREDFDIINGPFKQIIESCPSDPFDDPDFVALFGVANTPGGDFYDDSGFRITTPNESQIKISELETQIDIIKHSIEMKKNQLAELKEKLEEKKKDSQSKTTELIKFIEGAPNAQLSQKSISSRKNEIVVYAGEYNFSVSVVGKHSVPCKLTTELKEMKATCDTRLSSHHTNFKSTAQFVLTNDSELRSFVENSCVMIRIAAGKEEMNDVGYSRVSIKPFIDGKLQITQTVPILSPDDVQIGTLKVECACKRHLK